MKFIILLAISLRCVSLTKSEDGTRSSSLLKYGSDPRMSPETLSESFMKQTAHSMLDMWKSKGYKAFVQLASENQTYENILLNIEQYTSTLVLVTGSSPPHRRNVSGTQPYLALLESSWGGAGAPADGDDNLMADMMRTLPLAAINVAADGLEAVLQRPLYPLRITWRNFRNSSSIWRPPHAIYDISLGVIVLDTRVAELMVGFPDLATRALHNFSSTLYGRLAAAAGFQKTLTDFQGGGADSVLEVVLATAVGILLGSVGGQVPIWFCVACPAVLGLLAPFVINAAFAELADAACVRFDLPQDACIELWYGAFAAAMVLSLASAIPIVFICRLPECAKPSLRKTAY
eukprot:jgi/Botrbrau1/989/Bobra.114_1s0029.1